VSLESTNREAGHGEGGVSDPYYDKHHTSWYAPIRWWQWPLLILALPFLLGIALVYAVLDVLVNGIYE
jgi:hypothetical protein